MPRLIGLTICKNEQWVLGFSLRVALLWCDEIVVFDHNSDDDTPKIIQKISDSNPGRVHVFKCQDETWSEMQHRQFTLDRGRELGGTHFAVVDADEVVTGNLVPEVRSQIVALEQGQLFSLRMIPMWRSLDKYRDDNSVWSRATLSLAFADAPGVTWRSKSDGYQFHQRVPDGIRAPRQASNRGRTRMKQRSPSAEHPGGVMHLQWVDWRRMETKHCLYKCRETIYHPGRKTPAQIDAMYNQASNEDGIVLSPVPTTWLGPYKHFLRHINLQDEPWQLAEARSMIEKHGRERFAGLNFFGHL